MTVMLRANKEGDSKAESDKIMLKRRRVPMFDQIVDELLILFIYFLLMLAKANTGTINDSKICAHMINKVNTSDSVSIQINLH
jgi:hypothetical protein